MYILPTFHDYQYLNLLQDVLENGRECSDRTGTGTIKVFSRQMRFDISDGTIPLLTTKKMHIPAIIHEILWYLSGNDSIAYLKENGVRIWNEWASKDDRLGPVYGVLWRKWPHIQWNDHTCEYEKTFIDQLQNVINKLKTNPDDRRLLVSAWNPGFLPEDGKTFDENVKNGKQALPPCHYAFQFYSEPMTIKERIKWFTFNYEKIDFGSLSTNEIVDILDSRNIPTRSISCMLNQRSCDLFLGVPFNIVQYSILTRMVAHVVGMAVKEFVWNGGDVHIYNNHISQVEQQLQRTPYQSPFLRFARSVENINDFVYDDFVIENYNYHPTIKAPVSV